jgi:hypothetical protein
MTEKETNIFSEFLREFEDLFSEGAHDLGQTNTVEHVINTGDAGPIKSAARRVPMQRRQALNKMIAEMEENKVLKKSNSPWASPVVLAPKKDGTLRFCVDYRAINELTKKDAYPLPRIDDILESLQEAKYYCHLDLASGYWQVRVAEKDIPKTAFCVPDGLYEFVVMPFGLTDAPPTFQRLMNTVLKDHLGIRALVYLYDIIVWGKTIAETMDNLRLVFESVRAAGLKFKPSKCKFFRQSLDVLGHVVSPEGITTDPAKTELIDNWSQPRCIGDVRSFLGLASYYRKFIRNFADIARPLTMLTAKNVPFQWADDQETSFRALKVALSNPPVLVYPTTQGTFVLDTDASNNAIGAVLSQYQPGETLNDARVVAFGSKTLTDAERNYDTRGSQWCGVFDPESLPRKRDQRHRLLSPLTSRRVFGLWAQAAGSAAPNTTTPLRHSSKSGPNLALRRMPSTSELKRLVHLLCGLPPLVAQNMCKHVCAKHQRTQQLQMALRLLATPNTHTTTTTNTRTTHTQTTTTIPNAHQT